MNVLILEDEQLASEKLIKLLTEIDSAIHVLTTIKSVKNAVKWLNENPAPDLIFSDIQLSDGLSFDAFKQVNLTCPIIFTTAYDQYAIHAFEVKSVDYLLKPIKKTMLEASIVKFKNQYAPKEPKKQTQIDLDELLNIIKGQEKQYKARFLVKIGQKIKAVATNNIAYFFSENKMSFLVSKKNEKFPVDYSLDELNRMLNPRDFFKINRKFIIHVEAAKEIRPYFKGRLKVFLDPAIDEEVIISADKTPLFKKWLDQ